MHVAMGQSSSYIIGGIKQSRELYALKKKAIGFYMNKESWKDI